MGGSLCIQQALRPIQVLAIPSNPHPHSQIFLYTKVQNLSIRFGQIQKVKTSQNLIYKLLIPIINSFEIITIQCPILKSYSQCQLHQGTSLKLFSDQQAPIIDLFSLGNDKQIIHKGILKKRYKNLEYNYQDRINIKIYPFKYYKDLILKNGLYQIFLYKSMGKSSLKQYYIIQRGNPMSLVMIFQSYQISLFQLIMYRSLARFPWKKSQQIHIVDQLIKGYRQLQLNDIVHRDIRASKVYLKSKHEGIKGSKNLYQFVNLETARRLTKADKRDESNLLLTTRGVPFYTHQKVKTLLLDNAEIGTYPYQMVDRTALVRLIFSIVKLNPYQTRYQDLTNQNFELNQICQMLLNQSYNIQQINNKINHIVSIYAYQKDYGIILDDFNFSQILNKKLLMESQRKKIYQAYIQSLFLLHKNDVFIPKLIEEVNKNYKQKKVQLNVPILHRLGIYYQSIGVENNDYYRQQINLLTSLATKERVYGFYEKSNQYVKKSIQIQHKLVQRMKTSLIVLNLLVQESYNELYYNKNLPKANQYINQALIQAGKSRSLPLEIQLKILQAKGVMERNINNLESGDQYFEKGLDLCSQKNQFESVMANKIFTALFQYWLGKSLLEQMVANKSDQKVYNRKNIGKAQSYLNASINIRQTINTESVLLAKSLEALGDLYSLIQNHEEAMENYKRADVLFRTSEMSVSKNFQSNLLLKCKQQCQYFNDSDQIKQIESRLKQLERKQQRKQRQKPMKFGNDRKKRDNKRPGAYIIQQQSEEQQQYKL